jgi:L-ascorbate metabolism protein UlaG (beta-lactamase superfamily)
LRIRWLVLLLAWAGSAAADDAVTVRWLGVAGFSIQAGDSVLLHDPYFSRPGLWETLSSWYRPKPAVLEPLLAADGPAPELTRARAILIGHSHYDHLGDAPWLAQKSGARLIGSQTSVAIAQAYGLAAAQTQRFDPGDAPLAQGPFTVRVIESRHGKVLFGRVPFEGRYETPPEAPLHAFSFRLGDARLYLVRHEPSGVQILLASSASVHEPALEALRAEQLSVDLLLPATPGHDAAYARALVATFRPRVVVPHHFEAFYLPLSDDDAAAPRDPDDLALFESELREAAEAEGVAMQVRRLGLFESIQLGGSAAPASARR